MIPCELNATFHILASNLANNIKGCEEFHETLHSDSSLQSGIGETLKFLLLLRKKKDAESRM